VATWHSVKNRGGGRGQAGGIKRMTACLSDGLQTGRPAINIVADKPTRHQQQAFRLYQQGASIRAPQAYVAETSRRRRRRQRRAAATVAAWRKWRGDA